jgi:hypothetical protein
VVLVQLMSAPLPRSSSHTFLPSDPPTILFDLKMAQQTLAALSDSSSTP